MSETKEPKVKTPKFYEIIDDVVPFCPLSSCLAFHSYLK